eukprot:Nk52_evm44s222 gene=Nk52_evmTU44s222
MLKGSDVSMGEQGNAHAYSCAQAVFMLSDVEIKLLLSGGKEKHAHGASSKSKVISNIQKLFSSDDSEGIGIFLETILYVIQVNEDKESANVKKATKILSWLFCINSTCVNVVEGIRSFSSENNQWESVEYESILKVLSKITHNYVYLVTEKKLKPLPNSIEALSCVLNTIGDGTRKYPEQMGQKGLLSKYLFRISDSVLTFMSFLKNEYFDGIAEANFSSVIALLESYVSLLELHLGEMRYSRVSCCLEGVNCMLQEVICKAKEVHEVFGPQKVSERISFLNWKPLLIHALDVLRGFNGVAFASIFKLAVNINVNHSYMSKDAEIDTFRNRGLIVNQLLIAEKSSFDSLEFSYTVLLEAVETFYVANEGLLTRKLDIEFIESLLLFHFEKMCPLQEESNIKAYISNFFRVCFAPYCASFACLANEELKSLLVKLALGLVKSGFGEPFFYCLVRSWCSSSHSQKILYERICVSVLQICEDMHLEMLLAKRLYFAMLNRRSEAENVVQLASFCIRIHGNTGLGLVMEFLVGAFERSIEETAVIFGRVWKNVVLNASNERAIFLLKGLFVWIFESTTSKMGVDYIRGKKCVLPIDGALAIKCFDESLLQLEECLESSHLKLNVCYGVSRVFLTNPRDAFPVQGLKRVCKRIMVGHDDDHQFRYFAEFALERFVCLMSPLPLLQKASANLDFFTVPTSRMDKEEDIFAPLMPLLVLSSLPEGHYCEDVLSKELMFTNVENACSLGSLLLSALFFNLLDRGQFEKIKFVSGLVVSKFPLPMVAPVLSSMILHVLRKESFPQCKYLVHTSNQVMLNRCKVLPNGNLGPLAKETLSWFEPLMNDITSMIVKISLHSKEAYGELDCDHLLMAVGDALAYRFLFQNLLAGKSKRRNPFVLEKGTEEFPYTPMLRISVQAFNRLSVMVNDMQKGQSMKFKQQLRDIMVLSLESVVRNFFTTYWIPFEYAKNVGDASCRKVLLSSVARVYANFGSYLNVADINLLRRIVQQLNEKTAKISLQEKNWCCSTDLQAAIDILQNVVRN